MILRAMAFLLRLRVFDYARVQLVLNRQTGTWNALLAAIFFCERSF